MSVIDLGDVTADLRESNGAMPTFRVAITLPELRLLADQVGLSLPFETGGRPPSALEARLSGTGANAAGSGGDLAEVLRALPDPRVSLAERGVIAPQTSDGPADASTESDSTHLGSGAPVEMVSALRRILALLGLPEIAVDLDVAYGLDGSPVRLRVYHHAAGDQVAALASADGLLWEVALFPLRDWPAELARVATPPGGPPPAPSGGILDATSGVELPYVLMTVGCDLFESGKRNLVPAIVAAHTGQTTRAGRALNDDETVAVLEALAAPTGRLRALVTRPREPEFEPDLESSETDAASTTRSDRNADERPRAGIVSWVLLDQGWRALRPLGGSADPRVFITAEHPGTLAAAVSRLAAEVLP